MQVFWHNVVKRFAKANWKYYNAFINQLLLVESNFAKYSYVNFISFCTFIIFLWIITISFSIEL